MQETSTKIGKKRKRYKSKCSSQFCVRLTKTAMNKLTRIAKRNSISTAALVRSWIMLKLKNIREIIEKENYMNEIKKTRCQTCRGVGRITGLGMIDTKCPTCAGAGMIDLETEEDLEKKEEALQKKEEAIEKKEEAIEKKTSTGTSKKKKDKR
jgi:hypothetical protein